MSYVVIRTGGKQYRVSKGDLLDVEKLDVEEGKVITLDDVLLFVDDKKIKIGTPTLKTKVEAKVVSQFRGEKLRVGRFRHRKRHHKIMGHRQYLTKLEITGIEHV
ncbi:50S ribosomal protein L21 [Candidatus Roizmanbacteria bacterium CG22_combo_CG10-13_8_21_14_all_38_20]|uniref:Large ribosomal subunit protein bL21 n=1 Tax=Candidatus Roizmanbacteria bacterium CG22_combo_CG10-13_8_21_14_all_38_20 TaxID=1974862 RepID=A0A2H0BW13_9BACT|nr:50S ribosomal protein L21 [Candidatus Microgenomates bacterium]PIP61867.1 MAG: 50S ribosomal protein L21 [Candidatus Roizmanbacteria bacterium CG22_combo_CG10-13_8_21_14_all_38_20]PJC32158.1 MAG: 50S ribosomal protein L21 [Candidatus Roizmanbacteria bacterium CG_4_9_14_0_2_um_filter_38_17]